MLKNMKFALLHSCVALLVSSCATHQLKDLDITDNGPNKSFTLKDNVTLYKKTTAWIPGIFLNFPKGKYQMVGKDQTFCYYRHSSGFFYDAMEHPELFDEYEKTHKLPINKAKFNGGIIFYRVKGERPKRFGNFQIDFEIDKKPTDYNYGGIVGGLLVDAERGMQKKGSIYLTRRPQFDFSLLKLRDNPNLNDLCD